MDKRELKTKLTYLGTNLERLRTIAVDAHTTYHEIHCAVNGLYELARKEALSEFRDELKRLLEVVDNADDQNHKVKADTGDANASANELEEHLSAIEKSLRAMLK